MTTSAPATAAAKPNYSKKTLKEKGRKKRQLKLKTDKEFAKTYFDAKSKRANDKKAAFRKKKKGKK
jgi:hypothetical protein